MLCLQTVLLGDAAHTMHPVLGQGLNVGLEDAMLFVQCLERHGSNVDSALPAFNTERTPDIHAILTINEAVASGMGIAAQVVLCIQLSPATRFAAVPSTGNTQGQ